MKRGGRDGCARQREPRGEDAALAHAIGEQPPRQQGEDRADAEGGEDDPDLREREPVLVPELRRHDRNPQEDS